MRAGGGGRPRGPGRRNGAVVSCRPAADRGGGHGRRISQVGVHRARGHGISHGRASRGGRPRRHRLQPTGSRAEEWLAKYPGRAADTPAAAARDAEIVFACVGNDDDLRSVVLGPDGAFAGMASDAIFVDHTTASAQVARELYATARNWASDSSMRRSRAGRPEPRTACSRSWSGATGRRSSGCARPSTAMRGCVRSSAPPEPASSPRWSPDLHCRGCPGPLRGDQLRGRADSIPAGCST